MARVGLQDPIFFSDGGVLEFTQDLQDPNQFKTLMPGATFFDALAIDRSLGSGFNVSFDWQSVEELGDRILALKTENKSEAQVVRELLASAGDGVMGILQEVAATDIARALRSVVGQVATTVGFVNTTMATNVRGIYRTPLMDVVVALDYVNRIVNSDYFQQAVDGIAWIPIVGWIIKIVAEVLTLIANIAAHVRRNRIDSMTMELAQRFHLPLMAADRDIQKQYNETLTQQFLRAAKDYKSWWIFKPPYVIPGGDGKYFEAIAARDPESEYTKVGDAEVPLTQGWYVRGTAGLPGGGGFMPGGQDLYRQMEFMSKYCGAPPRSIGNYAPTARQTAAVLWQMTLKPGPSMFTVNAAETIDDWDAFVHGLLEYGERCILKGFTCQETNVRSIHGWDDCTGKYWITFGKDAGKKRTAASGWDAPSHMAELATWVAMEFWGRGGEKKQFPYKVRDTDREWSPDNFFYENTTYAHALKNLQSRQQAVLGGFDAFLVFPGTGFYDDVRKIDYTGGTGRADGTKGKFKNGVFPAFGDPSKAGYANSPMVKRWEDTIRMILQDSQLSKFVDWRDVPQYRWKGESPREILKAKQGPGGFMLAGSQQERPHIPSALPPPNPPTIPGSSLPGIDLVPPGDEGRVPVGMPRATKVMLAGAAAAGAVVGVNELYRLSRRKFFT